MYVNMSINSQLNLKKIVNDLKVLMDNIIEKLSFNDSKVISIEELVQIYSNDDVFLNDLQYINDTMDEIVLILETSDIFSQEYVDFLSIKLMSDYIIDDIMLYIQYSIFINRLLAGFNKLINSKVNNKQNYEILYSEFEIFLDNNERFFYLNIFKSSNKYEGLIDEITNILG